MRGPTSGPVTRALLDAAVASAAEVLGFEAATVWEPIRDGRGRVRLLAGAALLDPDRRPLRAVAEAVKVNPAQLAPSGLMTRGITVAMLTAVQAVVQAHPDATPAASAPVTPAVRPKRGETGWTDTRRNLEREARIVAAREAGVRPLTIAEREAMAPSSVQRILRASGRTFPRLKPGRPPAPPQPPQPPRVRAPAPAIPTPARALKSPRPGKITKTKAPVTRTQPVGPAVALPPPEPFPADHPAWAPLPGSTPVRLIDHRRGCRWPVTVEGASAAHVCDLGTSGGGSYCARHRWLSLAPSERAAATPGRTGVWRADRVNPHPPLEAVA